MPDEDFDRLSDNRKFQVLRDHIARLSIEVAGLKGTVSSLAARIDVHKAEIKKLKAKGQDEN